MLAGVSTTSVDPGVKDAANCTRTASNALALTVIAVGAASAPSVSATAAILRPAPAFASWLLPTSPISDLLVRVDPEPRPGQPRPPVNRSWQAITMADVSHASGGLP